MKAYGDKKIPGYAAVTKRSSCRCCNGSYAKVGRASNRHNSIRGLKKSSRQESKKEIKIELEENIINNDHYYEASNEFAHEMIEGYNLDLLNGFVDALRNIAPELGWADSDDTWTVGYGYCYNPEPRALSAIPYAFKHWAPQLPEDYSALLEQIIKERSDD